MAPKPLSPQTKTFSTTGITSIPKSVRVDNCLDVSGCSYINVLIAGHTINFLSKRQARAVHVSRLSQIPLEIFAKVFADNGAISSMSAQRASSVQGLATKIGSRW